VFRLGLRPRGSTTEAVERRLGCVSQDFLPRCDIRTTAGMGRDGTGQDGTRNGCGSIVAASAAAAAAVRNGGGGGCGGGSCLINWTDWLSISGVGPAGRAPFVSHCLPAVCPARTCFSAK